MACVRLSHLLFLLGLLAASVLYGAQARNATLDARFGSSSTAAVHTQAPKGKPAIEDPSKHPPHNCDTKKMPLEPVEKQPTRVADYSEPVKKTNAGIKVESLESQAERLLSEIKELLPHAKDVKKYLKVESDCAQTVEAKVKLRIAFISILRGETDVN